MQAAAAGGAPKDQAFIQNYLGTRMRCLGLRVPEQRRLYRQGYSFSTCSRAVQAENWDHVWHDANFHETRSQSCFFLEYTKDEAAMAALFPIARRWVESVDNWAHSDSLSSFFVRLLDRRRDGVYPVLVQWNRSKNPWKRRQSVVSLLVRAQSRSDPLPADKILPLVQARLDDEDHFVQRGIGWTLREAHRLYPATVHDFVAANASELSAVAFSAATEKYAKQDREHLKQLRRAARTEARPRGKHSGRTSARPATTHRTGSA